MLFAALVGGGPRFTFECYASRENEKRISKAVSQLLAGSPSGPGRSPGAARVLAYVHEPAGATPRPA
jgi:hypothetical protein